MEIACVLDSRLGSPARPGLSGGLRPGRHFLPDPVEAAERTEAMVRRLEAIGAAVESERAGEAFFAVDGLRGIHGGDSAGVLATARAALEGPPPRSGRVPSRRGRAAAGSSPPTGSPIRIRTAPRRFAGLGAGREAVLGAAGRAARLPRADLGRDPAAAARGAAPGGRGAGRHPGTARHRHPAGALADLRRARPRPLPAPPPAGPPARPRRGRAAAAAHRPPGGGPDAPGY